MAKLLATLLSIGVDSLIRRIALAISLLVGTSAAIATELSQPPYIEPDFNQPTAAKVALGKRLFSETALSVDDSYSCATCHDPLNHFVDGRKVAVGVSGQLHTRNTPTLYNVAYNASFGWDDQALTTLESQHLVPLFNVAPLEMGFDETLTRQRLTQRNYAPALQSAFSTHERQRLPLTTLIVRALASYVRTLTHPSNPFDDYMFGGDGQAMGHDARAGLELFTSERLNCSGCHASFTFSGPTRDQLDQTPASFHHTGVDGTQLKFRAPTLRAIRHTAPYMHAGNLATLEDVLNHYESAQSEEIPNFTLTPIERQQLIAFLEAL